jgi:hypothetical protein
VSDLQYDFTVQSATPGADTSFIRFDDGVVDWSEATESSVGDYTMFLSASVEN